MKSFKQLTEAKITGINDYDRELNYLIKVINSENMWSKENADNGHTQKVFVKHRSDMVQILRSATYNANQLIKDSQKKMERANKMGKKK